jgi:hypothetical protein
MDTPVTAASGRSSGLRPISMRTTSTFQFPTPDVMESSRPCSEPQIHAGLNKHVRDFHFLLLSRLISLRVACDMERKDNATLDVKEQN